MREASLNMLIFPLACLIFGWMAVRDGLVQKVTALEQCELAEFQIGNHQAPRSAEPSMLPITPESAADTAFCKSDGNGAVAVDTSGLYMLSASVTWKKPGRLEGHRELFARVHSGGRSVGHHATSLTTAGVDRAHGQSLYTLFVLESGDALSLFVAQHGA